MVTKSMITIRNTVWYGMMILVLSTLLTSCSDKRVLDERIAMNEVAYFLENNPVYETAELNYGEVRFRQRNDSARLDSYKHLEDYGYLRMELLKEKKRFLSKDSTFTYHIYLTDKSIPYVLDKTDTKAVVRTFYYELDDSQEAHIEQTGKNRAKVTVTLNRRETDFAMFAPKSTGSNASFIKKSYTFRFDENSGWRIAK